MLLKGAASVIRVPMTPTAIISASGCQGMARGGSGDILTGILATLLMQDGYNNMWEPLALASELHGLAGERAQEKYGAHAMNAADILEFLPEVFKAYVD